VQHKVAIHLVWVLVQVIDTVGVEQGGATLDAVYLVPLLQQEFRQVRTILTGNASDEGLFNHIMFLLLWKLELVFVVSSAPSGGGSQQAVDLRHLIYKMLYFSKRSQ
jgi:hypothetical protein